MPEQELYVLKYTPQIGELSPERKDRASYQIRDHPLMLKGESDILFPQIDDEGKPVICRGGPADLIETSVGSKVECRGCYFQTDPENAKLVGLPGRRNGKGRNPVLQLSTA